MITAFAAALFGTIVGSIVGAMIMDHYNGKEMKSWQKIADVANAERDAVRMELARSEALCDALSVEITHRTAQARRMESLYAERMRNTITGGSATWN